MHSSLDNDVRRDFRGGLHRLANPDEADDTDERMKGKGPPCQIFVEKAARNP
jgi:hypothetical protein